MINIGDEVTRIAYLPPASGGPVDLTTLCCFVSAVSSTEIEISSHPASVQRGAASQNWYDLALEGTHWIRGRHAKRSDAVRALLAAYALVC